MLTREEQQALTAGVAQSVRAGNTVEQAFAQAFDELGTRMLLERQKHGTSDSPEVLHLEDCFDFLQKYAHVLLQVKEEN